MSAKWSKMNSCYFWTYMRYLIEVFWRVLVIRVHARRDPPVILLVAHVTTDCAGCSRRHRLVGRRARLGIAWTSTTMLAFGMQDRVASSNSTRWRCVRRQIILNHGSSRGVEHLVGNIFERPIDWETASLYMLSRRSGIGLAAMQYLRILNGRCASLRIS